MQSQPNAAQPELSAAQPELSAAQLEPNAVQPEPNAVQPGQNGLQPRANSVQPEPNAAQPQPTRFNTYKTDARERTITHRVVNLHQAHGHMQTFDFTSIFLLMYNFLQLRYMLVPLFFFSWGILRLWSDPNLSRDHRLSFGNDEMM